MTDTPAIPNVRTEIRLLGPEDALWEQYHQIRQALSWTKSALRALGATEFPDEAPRPQRAPINFRQSMRVAAIQCGAKRYLIAPADIVASMVLVNVRAAARELAAMAADSDTVTVVSRGNRRTQDVYRLL